MTQYVCEERHLSCNIPKVKRFPSAVQNVIDLMQTRNDLYDYLGYHAYEQKLDGLFAQAKKK